MKRAVIAGLACCTIAAALGTPSPALAYLDPASGSMLLQLLLGGIAGIAVAARLFWRRFVGFLAPRKSDDADR